MSSLLKAVYDTNAFIPHAALLRQGCPHCAIFPTAASRRSLGRISVPMWPVGLSTRLPVVGWAGLYPTHYLMGRDPIPRRLGLWRGPHAGPAAHPVLIPFSRGYPGARGRLVTCYSPVRHSISARRRVNRSTCMC